MKKLLVTLCASLAVVSASVALAPSAEAAGRSGCVTRSEYGRVKVGTSRADVARIFGTSGTRMAISRSGGYTSELRAYRACSKGSAVAVSFGKNPGNLLRLRAKSAVWH